MTTEETITALEGIIERLKASLPKAHEPSPPVPEKLEEHLCGFRYFENKNIFWKMPLPRAGFMRHKSNPKWGQSICNISYFDDYGDKEVTAEEAEPKN